MYDIDCKKNIFETTCKICNSTENNKRGPRHTTCSLPFTLLLTENDIQGNITAIETTNFNNLVVTTSVNLVRITGEIVATFIINGVPTEITFDVDYFGFNEHNCTNTLNPKIKIDSYSFNISDGEVTLLVNGRVLITNEVV